jgi:tetratricopeptide (TPR) repeat protein
MKIGAGGSGAFIGCTGGCAAIVSLRYPATTQQIWFFLLRFIASLRNRNITHKKTTIAVLIMCILLAAGQGCCPALKEPAKAAASAPIELQALSENIKQLANGLEYSDKVGEDLVNMVNSWTDKQGRGVLAIWMQELAQAKENYQPGKSSKEQPAQLAKVEEKITNKLYSRIRKEVGFNQDFFDLANVTKHRQAQCLGYSQLFHVLGNSIGLAVKSTNVAEFKTGALPIGLAHTANIVNLTDGTTIMLDLMPRGFISMPFVIDEEFTKAGDYLELKNKDNPLGIDRKFQILGENELIAYIHNNRAGVYSKLGRYTEALAELNTAIELHSKYAEAYFNRGVVYRCLEQASQAVGDYDRAIELNPDFAEAYYGRANTYVKLGQFSEAVSDYDRAIGLKPDFAEAYYNQGNAYGKLGQYDHAVANYTKAIRLNSKLAEAYGNRGLAYALLKKTEEAKKDLLKAIELNSTLRAQVKMVADRLNLSAVMDER